MTPTLAENKIRLKIKLHMPQYPSDETRISCYQIITAALESLRGNWFLLVNGVASVWLGGVLTFQTTQNTRVNAVGVLNCLAKGSAFGKGKSRQPTRKSWEK